MLTVKNKQDIIKILPSYFPEIVDDSITDNKQLAGGTNTEIIFFNLKYKETIIPFIIKLFQNRLLAKRSKTEYLMMFELFKNEIKAPKSFGFLDNTCSFSRPFMILGFFSGKLFSESI